MGSIGAISNPRAEIGVATSSGKAYYTITSLLKKIGLPYVDVITGDISFSSFSEKKFTYSGGEGNDDRLKIIITTRKEKIQFRDDGAICIEDLGDDAGIAKQKLYSLMYPRDRNGLFVVGIDPGKRTGVAAFMNRQQIETGVLRSVDETISWVSRLLDNSPQERKVVKIGSGSPRIASEIASRLVNYYDRNLKIELVDERGTSALSSGKIKRARTRDQLAAEMIAFRKGREYFRQASLRAA